jgi:hypothetical protein
MNPWFSQQTAVFAWALAIYGRPRVPAAATPRAPPITERRLMLPTAVLLPCWPVTDLPARWLLTKAYLRTSLCRPPGSVKWSRHPPGPGLAPPFQRTRPSVRSSSLAARPCLAQTDEFCQDDDRPIRAIRCATAWPSSLWAEPHSTITRAGPTAAGRIQVR